MFSLISKARLDQFLITLKGYWEKKEENDDNQIEFSRICSLTNECKKLLLSNADSRKELGDELDKLIKKLHDKNERFVMLALTNDLSGGSSTKNATSKIDKETGRTWIEVDDTDMISFDGTEIEKFLFYQFFLLSKAFLDFQNEAKNDNSKIKKFLGNKLFSYLTMELWTMANAFIIKMHYEKIYEDHLNYDLCLMSMDKEAKLEESNINTISTKYNNSPVLIKMADKFSLYGFLDNKWQISELKLEKEENDILNKLPFEQEKLVNKKDPLLTRAVINIIKKSHVNNSPELISAFNTFAKEFVDSMLKELDETLVPYAAEICFPTGFNGHAMYLNFVLTPQQSIVLRMDNSGTAIKDDFRQRADKSTHFAYILGEISKAELLQNASLRDKLTNYIADICEVKCKISPSNIEGKRRLYLLNQYEQSDSPFPKFTWPLIATWPLYKLQTVQNCVYRGFSIGARHRIIGARYMPEEVDDIVSIIRQKIHAEVFVSEYNQKQLNNRALLDLEYSVRNQNIKISPFAIEEKQTVLEKLSVAVLNTVNAAPDQDLYTPLDGKYYDSPTSKAFDLIPIVKQFANEDNGGKNVLPILGDAATGKTQFSQNIAKELIEPSIEPRISLNTIYIRLSNPQIMNPRFTLVEETLEKEYGFSEAEVAELLTLAKKDAALPFALVFDGLDELLRMNIEYKDFLATNGILSKFANVRCFISSRPRIPELTHAEFEDIFVLTDKNRVRRKEGRHRFVIIDPFSDTSKAIYIGKFIIKRLKKPLSDKDKYLEEYHKRIKDIPNLYDVVGKPLMIKMAMETLEYLEEFYKTFERDTVFESETVKSDLYNMYILKMFNRYINEKPQLANITLSNENKIESFFTYASVLAATIDSNPGIPVIVYKLIHSSKLARRLVKPTDTDSKNEEDDLLSKGNKLYKDFFCPEKELEDYDDMRLGYAGCEELLVVKLFKDNIREGYEFSFQHDTFVNHFLTFQSYQKLHEMGRVDKIQNFIDNYNPNTDNLLISASDAAILVNSSQTHFSPTNVQNTRQLGTTATPAPQRTAPPFTT